MANHPHVRSGNAELSSQLRVTGSGFGALANVENVQPGELGAGVTLAGGVLAAAAVGGMSVSHVVGVAEPFKILSSVVRPVEVFVIDGLGRVRSGTEECFCHQSVYSHENLRTTTAEVEAWVSSAERGGQDAPVGSASVALDPVQATHSSSVRDFVEAFVSRYCAPLFGGKFFGSHRTSYAGLWSGLLLALTRLRSPFCV